MQANDFGSEVIPGAKDMGMHVQAYLYDGYWEDIGTIEAFYEANLALTKTPKPDFRCDMDIQLIMLHCPFFAQAVQHVIFSSQSIVLKPCT